MGWIYYFCLELGLYMLDESTRWFLCMHVSKACGAPADQDLQDFWMSWKSCIHCQVSLFCTYTKFPDRNEDLCGEIQRDNNLKLEWWTMDLGRVGSPDPPKWDFCLIFVWIIFFFEVKYFTWLVKSFFKHFQVLQNVNVALKSERNNNKKRLFFLSKLKLVCS